MGCLMFIAMPFVAIYKFLQWGFTNGAKGYITMIAVIIMVMVGVLVVRGMIIGGDEDPAGLTGIPDKLTAPFRVDTWSRVYYAEEAWEDEEGRVTMTNYWELRGEEWVYHKETFPFTEDFGQVEITERK
jgi:hypothetical protein